MQTPKLPLIGIDLMGGDMSPNDLFSELFSFLKESHSFIPVIFATSDIKIPSSFKVIKAKSCITMHDDPIQSIETKKDSSLCLGLQHLAEGKIDAFVSSGNTGALLVGSKTILDTLPGIERPALLTLLPTKKGEVTILDVGANISLKSKHLLQLASMGLAYQKSLGFENPKIALLNIGKEPSKGTPQLKEAYLLLEKSPHFIGNIEARDVFEGNVQILVTDGFAGNIFLKTAEGIASFILSELEETLPSELIAKLRLRLNYTEYPGAILCGVNGIVVKCHGDAGPKAFISSIKEACRLVQKKFLVAMKDELLKPVRH